VELQDKVAIVTGGARGIGGAIAERLAIGGAKVVIADLDGPAADSVVARISAEVDGAATAVVADVSATAGISRVIREAEARFGPVDIYFANAGVVGEGGLGDSEDGWTRVIEVNLLAHVRAAELLLPQWIERGSGYFVSTASAAGLLTQLGMAQYSATKHAAVAFAEWLSITYGDRGIRVSCICPMGANAVVSAGAVLEPGEVAAVVVEALRDERFLILPHEDVLRMLNNKARDYDGWLRAMRSYQARLLTDSGNSKLG
jgi:NAD(P)-dependent dehydrogenase (short-subunit alcohol dehydrogenase family)